MNKLFKIETLVLTIFLVGVGLQVITAQAQSPSGISVYDEYLNLPAGKVPPNVWYTLNENNFFRKTHEGAITLRGDTFYPHSKKGFVQISGICEWKKDPVRSQITVYADRPYIVGYGDNKTYPISVTVPAGPIQIQVKQENTQAVNGIRCTLAFEEVK